ncbi:energy transducer TonB family protein [Chamaesiphon minutus]|uniref:TonB family protein n=1 Tax=Chamaesiphon minutus (strain ATCC 27169 / PCC 6605) TaxID=1173020 RepID=K9UFD9_CHAP6|nr:energy transducer TonB [Chamaesiphon minutus]AFY93358.1 TonB family protein [Chamaesiphon minutus PCC 6605]
MEQLSFSATSRQNADKNLLNILLAGVGGSLVFHIVAIAGVAQWWKPVAAIDEPMEITMVDTDTEKPPAKPTPQPKVAPIVKTPAKVEPKPEVAKPVPIVKVPATLEPKPAPAKPVPIVKTASALNNFVKRVPTKTASKPAPKSVEPPLKAVTPPAFPDKLFKPEQPPATTPVTPKPKVAKSPTFTTPQPKQPKIATEPQPETPVSETRSRLATDSPNRKLATRSTDTPTPNQEQDFGQVTPSKVNAPTEEITPSNNNQSGLAGTPTNSSKLASKLAANNPSSPTEDNFGEVAPSKIKTPTTDDFAGSNNNQSGLAGKPTSGKKLGTRLAGNTPSPNTASDDNFGNIAPSKVNAPTNNDFARANNNQSGLAGKPTSGGKLGTRLAGNTSSPNNANNGAPSGVAQGNSWRATRAEPGAGLKPNSGNGSGDAGGKAFGLQCINRCEISGLTDLEDRDGGKDKLRIKIAIDPQGNVTSASIVKSSGNSTIDRVTIDGVKQMQFSPPGKVLERVVKANILL